MRLVHYLVLIAVLLGMRAPDAATPDRGEARVEPIVEVVRFGMSRAQVTPTTGIADFLYSSGSPRPTGNGAVAAGGELYLTADAIGVPEAMVDQIVRIFSGRLDFHRALEAGFTCTVLYEMRFEEGRIAGPGKILAVRLETPAETTTAYLLEFAAGDNAYSRDASYFDYYDAEGRSIGRYFLQSPIVFSRVTSGYSIRRFHPVLKIWRAHNGVDFAAPAGTPVHATADGVVQFAGVQGAYGNLIVLRHANGLSSRYGHLKTIAAAARPGQIVKQGDLLATVGMTGLATGPHLHYELRDADRPVDPSALGQAPRRPAAARKARFDELKKLYDQQLAIPYRTHNVQR